MIRHAPVAPAYTPTFGGVVVWAGVLASLSHSVQTVNVCQNTLALSPGADRGLTTVSGTAVYHHTVPRANISVFYERVNPTTIRVLGIGNHVGSTNKSYSIYWHDGKTISHTLT